MLDMFKYWSGVDTLVLLLLLGVFVLPIIAIVIGYILYSKELKYRRMVGIIISFIPISILLLRHMMGRGGQFDIILICIGICLLNSLFYFLGALLGNKIRKRKSK